MRNQHYIEIVNTIKVNEELLDVFVTFIEHLRNLVTNDANLTGLEIEHGEGSNTATIKFLGNEFEVRAELYNVTSSAIHGILRTHLPKSIASERREFQSVYFDTRGNVMLSLDSPSYMYEIWSGNFCSFYLNRLSKELLERNTKD